MASRRSSAMDSPTSTLTAAGITLEKHPASPVPPNSPPSITDDGASRLLGANSPAGSSAGGLSGAGGVRPGRRQRRQSLSPYAVTPGLTNGWPGMVRRHSAEVPRVPGQEGTPTGPSPTSPTRCLLSPSTAPVVPVGSRLGIPTDYNYARRPSAQCEHIRVKISPGSHAQVINAQGMIPTQQYQHGGRHHGAGHHHHHQQYRHQHHASNTSVGSPAKDPSPQGTPKNIYQHRRPSRQLETTGIPGIQAALLDPGHASTARRLSRTSIDSGQILMAAVRRASHQIDPADVVQFVQRRVSGERLSNYGDGGPDISPLRGSSSPHGPDGEEACNLLSTSAAALPGTLAGCAGGPGARRASAAAPMPDLHQQLFQASTARKLRRASEQRARRKQFVLVASIVFVGLVILAVLLVAITLRKKPDSPAAPGPHTGPDHWVRKGGIRDMTDPRISSAGEHHLLPPVPGAERKPPVPPATINGAITNSKSTPNTYHPPGRPIQRPKRRKRRRRRRAVTK